MCCSGSVQRCLDVATCCFMLLLVSLLSLVVPVSVVPPQGIISERLHLVSQGKVASRTASVR